MTSEVEIGCDGKEQGGDLALRLRRFFLGLGGAQCGADEVLAWSDGAVIPAIVFRGTGLELSLSWVEGTLGQFTW